MSRLRICKSIEEVHTLIENVKKTKYCSFDFETTSLDSESPDESEYPLVVGISFQPGSSWVIPLGHPESPFKKWKPILRLVGKELIQNPEIIKVCWNLKFEYKWCLRYNIFMSGRLFDGMLAKYLLDEEPPHGLKEAIDRFYPRFSGYAIDTSNLKEKPLEDVCRYCGIDCDLTLRLTLYFERLLIDKGFYNLFRNLLMEETKVLAESEHSGILIDRPYLKNLIEVYKVKITESDKKLRNTPSLLKFEERFRKHHLQELISGIRLEIERLNEEDAPNAGRLIANREKKLIDIAQGKFTNKERYDGFNFGSPKQLGEFLFTSPFGLKLPIVKYTIDKFKQETDTPSTAEDVLEVLKKKDKSGFMENLLSHRTITKLNSTYIEGLYPHLDRYDRIHAKFKIHGTVTGRLSCVEPNLQNIPRRATAADIKKMYIPPPGYLLLEVDYSQVELRIVAELADDKAMLDIFDKNLNLHTATACKINKVFDKYDKIKALIKEADSMTADELNDPKNKKYLKWVKEKKRGKTLNFSILYGEGPDKMAEELECSVNEAKEFIKAWLDEYPGIKKWIRKTEIYLEKYGFVKSIFGRKRRLHRLLDGNYGQILEAKRQAVNFCSQSPASDFGLLSQIQIRKQKYMGNMPYDMYQVYTVHDSLGYYIKPEDIHTTVPKILNICADPGTEEYFGFKMKKVYMKVSPEIGLNWADLKDYDPNEDYTKWITK